MEVSRTMMNAVALTVIDFMVIKYQLTRNEAFICLKNSLDQIGTEQLLGESKEVR